MIRIRKYSFFSKLYLIFNSLLHPLIRVPIHSMEKEWGNPLIRHNGQGKNGWDYYDSSKIKK